MIWAGRAAVGAVWATVIALGGVAAAESRPLRVVATIFPLAALAREVAGPGDQVVSLLPAGANPHVFEPTPSQVWASHGADLVVRIGLGFDDWVVPVFEGT